MRTPRRREKKKEETPSKIDQRKMIIQLMFFLKTDCKIFLTKHNHVIIVMQIRIIKRRKTNDRCIFKIYTTTTKSENYITAYTAAPLGYLG